MWLQLTLQCNGIKIKINMQKIYAYCPAEKDDGTTLDTESGSYTVKESFDEIGAMIAKKEWK